MHQMTLPEYITVYMQQARYLIIDDAEPYYGAIEGFQGLWATGQTLEECRINLESSLGEWLLFSRSHNLPIHRDAI